MKALGGLAVTAVVAAAALFGTPSAAGAQAGTDIWLAPLTRSSEGALRVGEPVNASRRPGYDNQPYFTPDSRAFWYTVIDEHTNQADIYLMDVESLELRRIVNSNPEAEYSATPIPDGSGISVIRVEADGRQFLWRFDHDGNNGRRVFDELEPVGYHKWVGDDTVVMFVLGDPQLRTPSTLRVGTVSTQEVRIVTEDIGRSIQNIPGTDDVSFVQNNGDGTTTITRLDPRTGATEPITNGVAGGDYHAWTPTGDLLQASGTRLMTHRPGTDVWLAIADFPQLGTLTRLAVSPDGRYIAMVADEN